MFRFVLSMFFCFCAGEGFSQSPDAFKGKLAVPDSSSHARVQVVEHGAAASTVRSLHNSAAESKIDGFRVCIFLDNKQNAREEAAEAARRFRELHPSIPEYTTYDNPYFKVTVGNCTSNEEAIILKGRIEANFPKAIISKESIPISRLTD